MRDPGRQQMFDALVASVQHCNLCPRLSGRRKILSRQNGNLNARVVFVGEAPGRLGADKTGIPFHGDQAGRNFEALLSAAGLERHEVFITNAVLCNPRDGNGNNAAPRAVELRNCHMFLSLVLAIVKPEFVIPLGHNALRALGLIHRHSMQLRRDVRRPVSWLQYTVMPMYHPGSRATVHRSRANQVADFYSLGEALHRRGAEHRKGRRIQLALRTMTEASLLQKIVYRIACGLGTVSKFKLAKMLYLLDWAEVKEDGHPLTGCYYMFQKAGPLPTGLAKALDEMEGHELKIRFQNRQPLYSPYGPPREPMDLPPSIEKKVADLVAECREIDDYGMKVRAYLTRPVRQLLWRQKQGDRILNCPVFEGWVHSD